MTDEERSTAEVAAQQRAEGWCEVTWPVPPPGAGTVKRRTRRYRGPRVLVGARIRPDRVARIDQLRGEVAASRNDWIEAALAVAMSQPEAVAQVLRTARSTAQLALEEEALDRSA